MEPEPAPDLVVIEPPNGLSPDFSVTTVPDLRRHPLVVGPGYHADDFYVRVGFGSLKEMAGVTPASIGSGAVVFDRLTKRNPVCSTL